MFASEYFCNPAGDFRRILAQIGVADDEVRLIGPREWYVPANDVPVSFVIDVLDVPDFEQFHTRIQEYQPVVRDILLIPLLEVRKNRESTHDDDEILGPAQQL